MVFKQIFYSKIALIFEGHHNKQAVEAQWISSSSQPGSLLPSWKRRWPDFPKNIGKNSAFRAEMKNLNIKRVFISFGCPHNQPLIALVYYKDRERIVRESELQGKNTRIDFSFLSRNVTSEHPNSTYTKKKIYELIADMMEGSFVFLEPLG